VAADASAPTALAARSHRNAVTGSLSAFLWLRAEIEPDEQRRGMGRRLRREEHRGGEVVEQDGSGR